MKGNKYMIIRILDILLSAVGLVLFLPLFLIGILISFIETGKPLIIQLRVGLNEIPFKLYKIRTMKLNTAVVATHNSKASDLTRFGKYLRKLKIDEIPQLINVIKGEMSLVGPRPCLINQHILIIERKKFNIYRHKPGITGLAQVQKIDMSDPIKLAKVENEMLKNFNLLEYFKLIFLTIFGRGLGDRVKNNKFNG